VTSRKLSFGGHSEAFFSSFLYKMMEELEELSDRKQRKPTSKEITSVLTTANHQVLESFEEN